MTDTTEMEPVPKWLAGFAGLSAVTALAAGLAWVWARWAVVIAISGDVLAYCFG